MSNKNSLYLGLVSLITVLLSVWLFWAGLSSTIFNQSTNHNQSQKTIEVRSDNIKGVETQNQGSSNFLGLAKVTKVIDGDTIEVEQNGQKKNLRYIGVDTPETVDPRRAVECFGRDSSAENKRLVDGKEVMLEKDVSETDKYNRLLRYVYLKLDDGSTLFVNDYLIRGGFGLVLTYPPDVRFSDRFLEAQNEAKENLRGLWSRCR